MSNKIELYYWPTPNGWKISIALEEMGLEYDVKIVDINKGRQFEKNFLKISPNNRIPAIVDYEGPNRERISLFESGAILQYLGKKTSSFIGSNEKDKIEVNKWLMWQIGGLGPMAGQAHHFLHYAPNMTPAQILPYAKDRYKNEVTRLYSVLNKNLKNRTYVAGNFFSIADMAIWPWASLWRRQEQKIEDFPYLQRWLNLCKTRPGVQRGRALLQEKRKKIEEDPKAQKILFNQKLI
jgi:GST-like protein